MTELSTNHTGGTRVVPPGEFLKELEGRSAVPKGARRGRVRGRRLRSIGAVLGVAMLSGGLVPMAWGTTVINMTTAGAEFEYNDVLFQQGPLEGSAGTGVLDPFLRIGANLDVVQGYNTDYRYQGNKLQFQEDAPWTESLLLSTVPIREVGGELYRAFFLDINQVNSVPDLSLDQLKLFLGDSPLLHDYDPLNETFEGGTYEKIFDLGDAYIHMNYALEAGSGDADVTMLVPETVFDALGAGCDYGQAGCTTWLYFWNSFGETYPNNDGFEEWSTEILPFVQLQKTATGTFDRDIDWDIDKTGSPLTHNLWAGDSADTDYDIDVTKTVTDTNIVVTGNVTITVPDKLPDGDRNAPDAVVTSLSDVFDQGGVKTNATFTDCQVPFTVKAGTSRVCAYTLTPPTADPGVNEVSVEIEDNPTTFMATANVAAFNGTVTGYDTVNVTDTFDGGTAEALGSTSSTFEFDNDQTFSCSSDTAMYTGDGFYSYTKTNVAEIVETGQTDDETVTVNCYAPVVSKTADGTFDRDWTWDIDKVGDQTSLVLAVGQAFLVNYDVTVSATSADSDYQVTGVISVQNPAGSPGSMNVDVADKIGTTNAVIDCGGGAGDTTLTVAAGATGQCSYTVDLGDTLPTEDTNTATVTFNGIDFEATDGFGFALDEETDECIDVSDDQAGVLGTVCADDLPKTFKYSMFVGPYAVCGDYEFVNVASFETNDNGETGSDDHTVVVAIPCGGCTLTQGYWKTHSALGPAPYDETWALLDAWFYDGLAWVHGDGSFDGHLEMFFLSGDTWHEVFWTAPAGNAYYNLAHQYQAAILNILNDASAPANVTAAIAHAEELFMEYTPEEIGELKGNKPLRKDFIATAGLLASYNEGMIGPGHCDEDSLSSIGY